MKEYVLIPVQWLNITLRVIGLSGLILGIFSAVFPTRSIQLYQQIMKWYNWRVEPIDLDGENRNTRWLGIMMVLISAALFWVMRSR